MSDNIILGVVDNRLRINDRLPFYAGISLLAIAGILLPLFTSGYVVTTLYFVFMYVALAQGWNYISGFAGYGTFGPHLFIGSGAYITAIFIVYVEMSWPIALILAALISTVFGLMVGVILLRISGIYFAIATLLVAEGARLGVLMETEYLKGSIGLTMIRLSSIEIYGLFGALAVLSTIVAYETATSEFGLRLLAVREDEQALQTLGVNPIRYKLPAFAVHALVTSLAGGIFALSLGFLFPSTFFSINMAITIIIIVVLGGVGSVWGPVMGALILIPLQEVIRMEFSGLHVLVFGITLIALVIFLPGGLIGKLKEYFDIEHIRGL